MAEDYGAVGVGLLAYPAYALSAPSGRPVEAAAHKALRHRLEGPLGTVVAPRAILATDLVEEHVGSHYLSLGRAVEMLRELWQEERGRVHPDEREALIRRSASIVLHHMCRHFLCARAPKRHMSVEQLLDSKHHVRLEVVAGTLRETA